MSRAGRAVAYVLVAVAALSIPVILVSMLVGGYLGLFFYWVAPWLNRLSRR
ncbi:hypothetical protein [Allokutzneria albata]|uniref:Uncharacterized protein n=1 Tax=Allokutzneria albata TaxID=211114 RepID=A0A1G9RDK5_ALLAB|nr:hypothetical protein [Allokutzneria albata]SDM21399.1 hypothetical protein SAMN04489726_0395 [Allokutzneria albata]